MSGGARKRKRGIAESLSNQQWLAKRDQERAEATRRALRERTLTPGFAPLQVPTLAEELHAMLDAHEPRPTLDLDPHYHALSRSSAQPPPRRVVVADAKHGTLGAYTNQRCRCDLCSAAMSAYNRAYQRRRMDLHIVPSPSTEEVAG